MEKNLTELNNAQLRNNAYVEALTQAAEKAFEVNLSKNKFISSTDKFLTKQQWKLIQDFDLGDEDQLSFDDLAKWWSEKYVVSAKEEFLKQSNCRTLIESFKAGKKVLDLVYWVSIVRGQSASCHLRTIVMTEDEATGDIFARIFIKDIMGKDYYPFRSIKYASSNMVTFTSTAENSKMSNDELRRTLEVISTLASEYSSVFFCRLTDPDLLMHPYAMNNYMTDCYSGQFTRGISYDDSFKVYLKNEVFEGDRGIVAQAAHLDNVRRELKDKKRFDTIFRCVENGRKSLCIMRIVKIDDEDKEPTAIVIGFTHEENAIIQQYINNNLLNEYIGVYYVDFEMNRIQACKPSSDLLMGNFTEANYYETIMGLAKVMAPEYQLQIAALADPLYLQEQFFNGTNIREITYAVPQHENKWRRAVLQAIEWKNKRPIAMLVTFMEIDNFTAEKMRLETEVQKALTDEYSNVCCIDIEAERFISTEFDRYTEDIYNDLISRGARYLDIAEHYVNNYVIPEDRERVRQFLSKESIREKLKDGKDFSFVFQSNITGVYRFRKARIVKIRGISDREYFVWAFSDADARVRNEIEKGRVKAASEAKSNFLFNMSHDIRTPMNAIMGFTRMARKNLSDVAKIEDCLTKVENSSEHLLQLINDVLDMARIESGKVAIEEKETDIREYTEKLISMMRNAAEKKNISLEVIFDNITVGNIYADNLHVNQILINILTNAIKYTRPDGKVRYTVHQKNAPKNGMATFEFIVEDNGIGMSEDFQKHIFESFVREKTTTASGIQGTGLGMSIVKKLVDLMRGDIEITSELGKGTKVVITLTFRVMKGDSQYVPEESEEQTIQSFSGLKILLVEDNELNREIASELLKEMGVEVDEADDGSVAVEKMREAKPGQYDLILMDIQMPYMDGYKATIEIRSLPDQALADIPIVAMTANVFDEDRKKALDVGMNEHLPKPIDIPKLIEVLEKFWKK